MFLDALRYVAAAYRHRDQGLGAIIEGVVEVLDRLKLPEPADET